MTSRGRKSTGSRRGTAPKKSSSSAFLRRSSRIGDGNVDVNSSGFIDTSTGFGGFASYTAGGTCFMLRPVNLGILADIATHFEWWRLHEFTLHYQPLFRPVSTSATAVVPGTILLAFTEDVNRLPASAPASGTIIDSESAREFDLDRAFSWTVRPKNLFGKMATTVSASSYDLRTSTAGAITFVTSQPSSFISGIIGKIYLSWEVSLSGGNPLNKTPDLALSDGEPERKEEKKLGLLAERKVQNLPSTEGSKPALDEYELIEYIRKPITPARLSVPQVKNTS